MAARLILNADDFGLTLGVNRSIEDLHHAGVLTSATLMATGDAFPDAVRIALRNPRLGVGCHIVLTDGTPVSDPATIPTLLGPSRGPSRRTFRTSLANFALDLLRGRIDPDDITREATAQIRRLQAAGLTLTHVDTHKHTHLFPAVLRSLLPAIERTGIHAIRNPFEPRWTHALGQGGHLRRAQLTLLRHLEPRFKRLHQTPTPPVPHSSQSHREAWEQNPSNPTLRTTDGSLGVSATGDLTPSTLTQLLHALPPEGTFELVCHPGHNDADLDRIPTRLRSHREVESHALLTSIPARLAQFDPPTLIHFGNLTW